MENDPKSGMMKRVSLYWSTIRRLKLIQMVAQVKTRVLKPSYRMLNSKLDLTKTAFEQWSMKNCSYIDGCFDFLNISAPFVSWNDISHGMLWTYNLNYMDWLLQEDLTFDGGFPKIWNCNKKSLKKLLS